MAGVVQVAGVIDEDEAAMLVAAGVDWLGFPFCLPVHHEDLSRSDAASIIANLPTGHRGVLITYLSGADDILRLCEELGVSCVQLHGEASAVELERLRTMRADLIIVKSLVIGARTEAELRDEQAVLCDLVDYFITDTHDPATGADGATGRTHDWGISRRLARESSTPLLLAGGLDGHNVAEAIGQVRPAGVDAHTRLEGEDGRKIEARVRAFVSTARQAFSRSDVRN